MRYCLLCSVAAVGVLLTASSASATMITPGGPTVIPNVQTYLPPGFVVVADTGPKPQLVGSTGTGIGEEWVVVSPTPPTGDTTNTGTTVSFIYQVSAANFGAADLGVGSFLGFTTDVGQNSTLPLPHSLVGVTGYGSTVEDVFGDITADYTPALLPGTTSFLLIVNTNAVGYTPSTFALLDHISATFAGYAPSTTPNISVPEPSSAILGIGCVLSFAGVAGWRRRRAPAAT